MFDLIEFKFKYLHDPKTHDLGKYLNKFTDKSFLGEQETDELMIIDHILGGSHPVTKENYTFSYSKCMSLEWGRNKAKRYGSKLKNTTGKLSLSHSMKKSNNRKRNRLALSKQDEFSKSKGQTAKSGTTSKDKKIEDKSKLAKKALSKQTQKGIDSRPKCSTTNLTGSNSNKQIYVELDTDIESEVEKSKPIKDIDGGHKKRTRKRKCKLL